MQEPISIESTTVRDSRIAFFQHRNRIIGEYLFFMLIFDFITNTYVNILCEEIK